MDHEWFEVRSPVGSYIECKCGVRPKDEHQFNVHSKFMQD